MTGKADVGHGHELADIALLETALLQKLSAPVSPPIAGQILRAIGPDAWEWSTVQFGEGGAIALPSQIVNTVNGQTGNVTIALPGLATTTTNGLLSSANFSLLTGQNAANGNVLQIVNNVPVWGTFTVPATPDQWITLNTDATLELNKKYLVTGGTTFTLPAISDGFIEVINNRDTRITITASGTATIAGYSSGLKMPISSQEAVGVGARTESKFVSSTGVWNCVNCDPLRLTFAYNGTPLAPNDRNPSKASDLPHWLGIQAGGGTWVNPSGTSWLTAEASSVYASPYNAPVSVLSNRAAPSSSNSELAHTGNDAINWFAWQLPNGYRFRPTGILLLTRGDINATNPRDFTIRIANGNTLFGISTWTSAQVFTNQVISGPSMYYYTAISTSLSGRQLAFEQQQNSSGSNWLLLQEVCWFGDLFLP